ncbi:MAG: hypothetical protein ABIH04_05210 [Planctomycetota bacterium]
MPKDIKNRSEAVLLLFFAEDNVLKENAPIEGITRLEKMVFLIEKESNLLRKLGQKGEFGFRPYKMGPFSSEIYDEVDFLESLGLVNSRMSGKKQPAESVETENFLDEQMLDKYQKEDISHDDTERVYKLTEKGKEIARGLFESLPEQEQEFLVNLKKKFNRMSLRQLLRYIYKKYPDYATESEIKDYLGFRY